LHGPKWSRKPVVRLVRFRPLIYRSRRLRTSLSELEEEKPPNSRRWKRPRASPDFLARAGIRVRSNWSRKAAWEVPDCVQSLPTAAEPMHRLRIGCTVCAAPPPMANVGSAHSPAAVANLGCAKTRFAAHWRQMQHAQAHRREASERQTASRDAPARRFRESASHSRAVQLENDLARSLSPGPIETRLLRGGLFRCPRVLAILKL
jgi:hypothetical protein